MLSILYAPLASVVADRTCSIKTGLAASTVTPGSTAPVASFTTPANALCARAAVGSASSAASMPTDTSVLLIIRPPLLAPKASGYNTAMVGPIVRTRHSSRPRHNDQKLGLDLCLSCDFQKGCCPNDPGSLGSALPFLLWHRRRRSYPTWAPVVTRFTEGYMRTRVVRSFLIAVSIVIALPAAARAQSAIAGSVTDTTGAILPGVTVEASSEALIEKTRAVVTDDQGNYKIVDLRPGTYVLTFTLAGFQSVRREALELPSNFTMTINADLRVGSLEETLTVTGASPVVDVQTAAKAQVLNREVLDSVPTGRTIQGLGQLVTGITLSTPDVGGTRAMQQTYMSAHGMISSQVTVQVDGMLVNGVDVDGAVQNYFNSSMSQEMVYQTSGAMADVSGGGIKLNMIPKDGGNRFNGSLNSGYQPKQWQGDNLTADLQR